MANVMLVYSPAYRDEVEEIFSDSLIQSIYKAEDNLLIFPDMGSPDVRPSLVARYGTGLRKLVVGDRILVYRHVDGVVHMLACVHGSRVR